MLHRIQLPDCVLQLEQILKFQRDVLAVACSIETVLPLTREALLVSLGDDRGDWLWQKLWKQVGKSDKTDFHLALLAVIEFVQNHHDSGQVILDSFDHDVTFHTSLDDPNFRFQFSTLDDAFQKVLKPLMISFYEDLLSAGFGEAIHGQSNKLNRDGFIESFWTNNHLLEVCPACDRQRSDKVDNKVYDDADHFLPKSKYPFLSLHYENLVPLCIYCNRSFKGDRDSIDDQNDAPLTNIFHPYERPALEYICVFVNRSNAGVPQIELEDQAGMPSRRVQNLKRVFRLHERWPDHLRYQIENIRDEISEMGHRIQKYSNTIPDPNTLKSELEEMVQQKRDKIGRRVGCILQKSYLEFVLRDNDEFEELFKYFCEE